MKLTQKRRFLWLVPVQGVFRDLAEEDFRPPRPFSVQLEPGLDWRSKTQSDEQLIKEWYRSWGVHLGQLTQRETESADSVLSAGQGGATMNQVASFVLALSLHTRVPLVTQRLLFRWEGEGEPFHEGFPPARTVRLREWPEDEAVNEATRREVVETFDSVRRIRQDYPETGLAWALGAYRSAISSHDFVDAVAILACASLEALSAADKQRTVIDRLSRYSSAKDSPERLHRLYKLRQRFAHGNDVPEMRDADVRAKTLDDGLATVKEILRAAIVDPDLLVASRGGVRSVAKYLGHH